MAVHFGVDYYPEHWSKDRWERDAELMAQMGLEVVRLGEFSWHKMERQDGVFDFAWLDEAIGVLSHHGIRVVLGTPTAAPPAWMVAAHPEILPVDREGRRRGFGGRHHDCQSNATYRHYVERIVEQLSVRYGNNENVIGWQVDNELGNAHGDLCFCESCRSSFQAWLKQKYGTVDNLNRAWGNHFWSQEVNSFDEVFAPRITVTGENPSALLDWKLFHSWLIEDFLVCQERIIRKNAPHQFVTHNFMGFADLVDYYELARHLDFVSHDQYPMNFYSKLPQVDAHELAATLDVVRGYKGKPFWIMEQQSGPAGWQTIGRTPAPGQLALWTAQSVAHGADCVVFFRWRTCTAGTEQYWHGILPHSGKPGRRYNELSQAIEQLKPLMERIQGASPRNDVAIIYSFRQRYALDLQPQNPDLSYVAQILKYYKAFYDKNVGMDFVSEDADLLRYKLVVAPLLYITDGAIEGKFTEYVEQGGQLVLTMRCGVKDEANLCKEDTDPPGELCRVAGVTVEDYDCLNGAAVSVEMGSESFTAQKWADVLRAQEGVEVIATYKSGWYRDTPCVTSCHFGDGECWYVAVEPDDELMAKLAGEILTRAGVKPLGETDAGVELCQRGGIVFALNHTADEKRIGLPEGGRWTAGSADGKLPPYGWAAYSLG